MILKVINQLKIKEVDGKDTGLMDQPLLTISNHGLREDMVVLEFQEKRITVHADLLRTAIVNSTAFYKEL